MSVERLAKLNRQLPVESQQVAQVNKFVAQISLPQAVTLQESKEKCGWAEGIEANTYRKRASLEAASYLCIMYDEPKRREIDRSKDAVSEVFGLVGGVWKSGRCSMRDKLSTNRCDVLDTNNENYNTSSLNGSLAGAKPKIEQTK